MAIGSRWRALGLALFWFATCFGALPTSGLAQIVVNDAIGLEAISNNLSGNYVLGNDIVLPNTLFNFVPIGTTSNPFLGILNGNGHIITNLHVGPIGNGEGTGLFDAIGSTGTVSNLNLANVTYTGGFSASGATGGLAGFNSGFISNDHVISGQLTEGATSLLGGLVGDNTGIIQTSSATVNIAGVGAGGLVGTNEASGTITRSSSSGQIGVAPISPFGGGGFNGGLVGDNSGIISQSFSTASVGGLSGGGGLVGFNSGATLQSYATGAVSSLGNPGGLVAQTNGGTLSEVYAAGAVSAVPTIFNNFFPQPGGLVGVDTHAGPIGTDALVSSSYWDTQVTGQQTALGREFGGAGLIGSATGLTTAQLQSGILPTGFDPNVWTATPGQYPTLIGVGGQQPPLTPVIAAQLSDLSYHSVSDIKGGKFALPQGYSIASFNNNPNLTLDVGDPSGLGLHAVVFQGPANVGLVVAIEGSISFPLDLLTSPSDWANLGIVPGLPNATLNSFYQSALNFLTTVQAFAQQNGGEPVHLTGHSLGGGLAQVLGSVTGLDTITFNAPGMKLYMQAQGQTPKGNNSNIKNYRMAGDIVSLLPGQNTQVGEVISLSGLLNNTPLDPLMWLSNHSLSSIEAALGTPPISDLKPGSDGTTDTASLYTQIGPIDLTVLQAYTVLIEVGVPVSVVQGGVSVTAELYDLAVQKLGKIFLAFMKDPNGFDFATGAGDPNFASITLPFQLDPYDLQELIGGNWIDEGLVLSLETFNFPDGGVGEFRVLDVDPDNNPFIAGVAFEDDGRFTGTITPISDVPEPSSLEAVSSGLIAALVFVHRRRRAGGGA